MLWEVEIRPRGRDAERDRVCDEFDLLTHSRSAAATSSPAPPAASSSKAIWARPPAERLPGRTARRSARRNRLRFASSASIACPLSPCCSSPASWTRSPRACWRRPAISACRSTPSAPSAATSARPDINGTDRDTLFRKVLANDAIEQIVVGPLQADHLTLGPPYTFPAGHRAAARPRRRGPGEAQQGRAALAQRSPR